MREELNLISKSLLIIFSFFMLLASILHASESWVSMGIVLMIILICVTFNSENAYLISFVFAVGLLIYHYQIAASELYWVFYKNQLLPTLAIFLPVNFVYIYLIVFRLLNGHFKLTFMNERSRSFFRRNKMYFIGLSVISALIFITVAANKFLSIKQEHQQVQQVIRQEINGKLQKADLVFEDPCILEFDITSDRKVFTLKFPRQSIYACEMDIVIGDSIHKSANSTLINFYRNNKKVEAFDISWGRPL